ncbi:sensor histidine kinase [Edaphovirga cremea]|uniref:sensor histidine kinase n=1 Tax=Edaphovirga cremea TaxID=2267246 RepID=UPI000DEFFBBC|nr:sensor histidine kinase [Edaphovirga cremea]
MRSLKIPLKLSTSVILMVSGVIISVLLAVHSLFFNQISQLAENSFREKAFAISRTLAITPEIVQGLSDKRKAAAIQPFAERVKEQNGLLFITVTDMQGIRYSHPNASLLGKLFVGDDIFPALKGKENQAINQGTLERALRVFTPVYNSEHQQIGVVALGISLVKVQSIVNNNRQNLLWTALFGCIVGGIGTWLLVSALKRIMLGFEPHEIANLFEERNAMLQSMKEGVIAVDQQGQITLINDEAERLFKQRGPKDNMAVNAASEQWPELLHLQEVMNTGVMQRDRESHINGNILLSNTVPVRVNGEIVGAIATFRDKTEVSQLLERLSGMSTYADALRTQAHEFKNKLHVILGMLHLKHYQELERYILNTAQNYQDAIGSLIRMIKSPEIAGFLLGKMNRARDLGITLQLTEESFLPYTDDVETTNVIITALGNVLENAFDALSGYSARTITVSFDFLDGMLHCTVSDDGPGIEPDIIDKIFQRGFSTKGNGRGIGLHLAKLSIQAHGGNIDVKSERGIYTRFYLTLPYLTDEVNHD